MEALELSSNPNSAYPPRERWVLDVLAYRLTSRGLSPFEALDTHLVKGGFLML
jgi:hypothetical protein